MSDILYPKISDYVILPPFKDEKKFEDFILIFFNKLEKTNSYDLFGRKGQKQSGLDVFSVEKQTVIQCKCKISGTRKDTIIRDELLKELEDDFEKFVEFNQANGNKFKRFLFVSTFKDDIAISTECIKRTTEQIQVEYWSWNGLMRKADDEVCRKYYGNFLDKTKEYYESENVERTVETDDSTINERSLDVGKQKSNAVGFKLNKTNPILEQIHDYISFKFKEVNNVPIHLLTRNYPFKKEDSFFPHYTIFTLSTDNEELLEFFESVKIEKDGKLTFTKKEFTEGVKKYQEKTKMVLSRLSENLIFNLESKKSHKRINILYSDEKKSKCVTCRFFRFEFSEAFQELSTVPTELDEKFKLAYVQYQIGNYLKAEKLLTAISRESKKKKLNIRQFIAQFNLSKLSIFIRNHYWGENAQDKLVEKLKKINLEETYSELANTENEKLLDWIKSNSFYSESRDKIQETVTKIRDHYYSQLKGGWSSNNHIWQLINEYAKIDTFLNNNYIIYDGFNEFRELTEVFTEGLFASHAIDKTHSSRLENFDDWLINKIVFYAKSDKILKHFERYGLKEITYKQTSSVGDSFIELLTKFLDENSKTRNAFEKYCEGNNRHFWDRYNTIFSNLMVMAGLCDLKKSQVNEIAEKLLKFLKTEKSVYPYNIKYARFFINRKGKQINKSTLKGFLLMTIENGKTHGEDFIEAVAGQIKKHHGEIKLAAQDYTKFEKLAFDKCPVCKHVHSGNFMVLLYEIIGDEGKKEQIKQGIKNSLMSKYNTELYYTAAIYGILEPEGNLFEQFIKSAKPVPNRVSFKKIFTGKDDTRYPNLNMLINLCYKYGIVFSKKRFNDFWGIDNYYDWLLDMKGFDYCLFNPKWVSEYATQYYFKEIRKHEIIKKRICEYLIDNRDPQLERDFIELFCDEE